MYNAVPGFRFDRVAVFAAPWAYLFHAFGVRMVAALGVRRASYSLLHVLDPILGSVGSAVRTVRRKSDERLVLSTGRMSSTRVILFVADGPHSGPYTA